MLSKKTVNIIMNNNYNAVSFDLKNQIVQLTDKKNIFSLKKNIQTIMFYELKNYCELYAKKNSFIDKINANESLELWFKNFETEFKKHKK